jgi:hypothetical protein
VFSGARQSVMTAGGLAESLNHAISEDLGRDAWADDPVPGSQVER